MDRQTVNDGGHGMFANPKRDVPGGHITLGHIPGTRYVSLRRSDKIRRSPDEPGNDFCDPIEDLSGRRPSCDLVTSDEGIRR